MQSMGGCCCSDRHAGRVVRWCRSCPITAWRVQRWGRIRPINNAGGRKKRKREGKKKASRGRRRERKNKASLHFLPSILCRNRLFRVIIIHRLLSHLLALSFAFSFPTPFSSSSRISFFQSSRPPPPPPTPTGRISQLQHLQSRLLTSWHRRRSGYHTLREWYVCSHASCNISDLPRVSILFYFSFSFSISFFTRSSRNQSNHPQVGNPQFALTCRTGNKQRSSRFGVSSAEQHHCRRGHSCCAR